MAPCDYTRANVSRAGVEGARPRGVRRARRLRRIVGGAAWLVVLAGCSQPGAAPSSTGVRSSASVAGSSTTTIGEPTTTIGEPTTTPASAQVPLGSTATSPASGGPAAQGAPTDEAALATKGALVDPATISGQVMSQRASAGFPRSFEGRVTAVKVEPSGDDEVEWELGLLDGRGSAHQLYVYAPRMLPVPLRTGDAVRVRVVPTGGGPNSRNEIEVRSAAGPLLLAVNLAPADWVVKRGRPAGRTPGGSYDEQSYAVEFEHGGERGEPASTRWARVTIGPRTYYLWGHAAERTLHPGKSPMPDYVGGWLDFAIVLAR